MKQGTFIVPNQYHPMFGTPGYWRDESGDLPAAVTAYHKHICGEGPITQHQIERIAGYIDYFIHAPCWDQGCKDAFESELSELRQRAKGLNSVESIRRWIEEAMDLGLDPF